MSDDEKKVDDIVNNIEFGAPRKRISSRGVTAIFKPLPPLMRELIGEQMEKEGFDRGKPPTYEVETFGGDMEEHIHDEKSIEGDALAEAAWLEYLETQKAWEVEYNQRLFNLCMVRCMEVEGLDDDKWIKGQEHLGFEIPEDPIERKIHYIKTEFIGNNEDYLSILQIPFELAISPSEIQAAAERMFRKLKVAQYESPEGTGSDTGEEELDVAGGSAGSGGDVPETGDST